MPYDIRTKDGILIKNIPDDVDRNSDIIKQKIQAERIKLFNPDVMRNSPNMPQPDVKGSFADEAMAAIATPTYMAASTADEVVGGLSGLAQSLNPYAEAGAGARAVEQSRANPFLAPTDPLVQRNLTKIGEAAEATLGEGGLGILNAGEKMGAVAMERFNSPILATIMETLPAVTGALLGVKGYRTAQGDIELKDAAGRPNEILNRVLNEKGLVYDALPNEVKNQIPSVVPRTLVGNPKGISSKQLAAQDIQAGGRQPALAPYEVTESGKLADDPLAKKALRQEWPTGVVQMVKTATPKTKDYMRDMMAKYRETKDQNIAARGRPTDMTGKVVESRVKYINSQINNARNELDLIVKNKMQGTKVDIKPLQDMFNDGLERLDVSWNPNEKKYDYDGSVIMEDKGSQALINKSTNLLRSALDKGDAAALHRFKRQLDTLANWEKLSKGGLTEEGRSFIKSIRSATNQILRDLDPDYARVNDVMSKGLSFLGDLNRATAAKVDVFNPEAMGTEARKLFGNSQKRTLLNDSFETMDDLVRELQAWSGTKNVVPYTGTGSDIPQPDLDISVRELARFADALDKQFGSVASTSFAGDIEGAINAAQTGADIATGGKVGMIRGAMDAVKRKVTGPVDEFEAFVSMEELLKRGGK